MIVQTRTTAPALRANQPAPPAPPENEPAPPQEEVTLSSRVIRSAVTVAANTIEAGAYYWAGGGTVGGAMRFGAAFNGFSMAYDLGKHFYDKGEGVGPVALGVVSGGAVGGLLGAAKGWGTITLANAFGGGMSGALTAGACLGLGQVIADELGFGKS